MAMIKASLKRWRVSHFFLIYRILEQNLKALPASLCHEFENRGLEHIQQVLDAALRSALARLSRPENYLSIQIH
jgi:hypothetical protein